MTHRTKKSLEKALEDWKSVLTRDQIVQSEPILKDSNTTTYQGGGSYELVLYPKNTEQVSDCLAIATAYNVAVYTVSKGKNYGLGSKISVKEDYVLLDLSQMNEILDFSEEMAYVTLQPGVTFEQLADFLRSKNSDLIMDSIGSTGQASIIGNAAERGHGVALQADRFSYCCGMEVVLPNGEIIHTGFESIENNKVGPLAKWGLGPAIDGLFTQSNLGVITKLTYWLQAKPKHFQIVLFQVSDDENLKQLSEKARGMMLNKLSFSLRIFNDYRMLGFSQQYPWEQMKGETPLSKDVFQKIKNKSGIHGKWIGIGALYSINPKFAEVEKSYVKEQLAPYVESLDFYDEAYAAHVNKSGTSEEKDFIDFIYNFSSLRGYTSERALNMCYWRMKNPIPEQKDLHRDNCGVLWYCPVIPNRAEDIANAVNIIEETSLKYKMEPNVGFLYISERVLDITGAICFDKTCPEQDKNAKACHEEIINRMVATGYPMYRLGVQSMHISSQLKEKNVAFNKALKHSVDPKNILNRGRYID